MGMGRYISAFALAAVLSVAQGPIFNAPQAEAAAQMSPAEARKTVLSGIKAFEAGSMKTCVSSLSHALSSGGLTGKDMAKALYYRGRAYRKQGKHAQAISDLTSAIWLKNGLSEAEKAKALQERSAAYKSAGVASPTAAVTAAPKVAAPAPVVAAPAPRPTPSVAKAAVAAPAPVQIAQANTSTKTDDGFAATVTPSKAPAATVKPTKKAVSGAYQPPEIRAGDFTVGIPARYQTTDKAAYSAPTTTPAQAATAQAPTANPIEGVSTFFSNLFGSVTGAGKPTQAPATNFAGSSSQLVPGTNPPRPATAVSAWNNATEITTGSTPNKPRPTKVAAVIPRKTAPAPKRTAPPPTRTSKPSKPGGRYGLQVAVLKTRKEAESLAAKLMQKHGTKFGARAPSIDEQVFGNMGTFYRVQIGAYASTREPKSVCSKIASDGYDCFVVEK